nr:hypothetical protein [Parachlamydiaceae bacterium]
KSLAEQTSVWTPLNAAKATVALGATGVGAAIAGGLMAPVLLPAFLTAQVAAGIGAVGSALYGVKLAYDHNVNQLPASPQVTVVAGTPQ